MVKRGLRVLAEKEKHGVVGNEGMRRADEGERRLISKSVNYIPPRNILKESETTGLIKSPPFRLLRLSSDSTVCPLEP